MGEAVLGPPVAPKKTTQRLFTAAAKSLDALEDYIASKDSTHNVPPSEIALNRNANAKLLPYRTFAVAESQQTAQYAKPVSLPERPKRLMFTFGGTGPQYWQQGHDLMRHPVFAQSVYECDKIHVQHTGRSFLSDTGLFIGQLSQRLDLEHMDIWPGDVVCLANAIYQIAMYDLLRSINVSPDVVLGFSLGETTALYGSGAISREMAVKIVIAIGRALLRIDNSGGLVIGVMDVSNALVMQAMDTLPTHIRRNLYISSFITPTVMGVVGPSADVEYFADNLPPGASYTRIHVGSAVHSPFLDLSEAPFREEVERIFELHGKCVRAPVIPMMSSVTGEWKTDAPTVDYVWDSIRRTILMKPVVEKLVAEYGEQSTFIELSPHPSLSPYIEAMGAGASFGPCARPPSARRLAAGATHVSEHQAFLQACGRLFTYGIDTMDLAAVNKYDG